MKHTLLSVHASLGGHLHEHYATTYRLHRDAILNTSRYFHVTEGLVPVSQGWVTPWGV